MSNCLTSFCYKENLVFSYLHNLITPKLILDVPDLLKNASQVNCVPSVVHCWFNYPLTFSHLKSWNFELISLLKS